jgi:deoxyhypusine monooxygenase
MDSTSPVIIPNTLSTLKSALLNVSGSIPLAHRFRALFTLKSFGKSTAVLENEPNTLVSDAAIQIIAEGFNDPSALLKHELAYVLGQMGNLRAVPVLEHVLGDKQQDAMVRHEVRAYHVILFNLRLIASDRQQKLSVPCHRHHLCQC